MPTTLKNWGIDMGKVKQSMTEQEQKRFALLDIAMVRGYNFAMEYDSASGRVVARDGHGYIKEGYIEGFLDGVAYRFEQSDS